MPPPSLRPRSVDPRPIQLTRFDRAFAPRIGLLLGAGVGGNDCHVTVDSMAGDFPFWLWTVDPPSPNRCIAFASHRTANPPEMLP